MFNKSSKSSNSLLPPTEALPPSNSGRTQKASTVVGGQKKKALVRGHFMAGVWAIVAAIATAHQISLVQFWECHTQTLFFKLRGPVASPQDILILAMDDDSVKASQFYRSDPNQYAYLAPLRTSPPKRSAYAIAVDRLMKSGARTVSIDVLFDAPSDSPEEDAEFENVLRRYAGRVTLAAVYNAETTPQGEQTELVLPDLVFRTSPASIGFINYPLSLDGRIHRLGSTYPQLEVENAQRRGKSYPPEVAEQIVRRSKELFFEQGKDILSFAEATLKAARIPYQPSRGHTIFFYGPDRTFPHIPLRDVLDPETWNQHLQQETFRNKIVLIGPTAKVYQDLHATPFSKTFPYTTPMAGVEVNANAIATLLENKSIAEAIPNPSWRGATVLVIVLAAAGIQSAFLLFLASAHRFQKQLQPSLLRFILAAGTVHLVTAGAIALAWGGISYFAFVNGQLILPVAAPMAAISLSGVSYFVAASASEYRSKLQIVKILAQFPRSEVVQRILHEYVEFQDLLQEPEQAFFGKILKDRYRVTKVLGSGGFGRTYIAEDTQRPGNPLCVVKQLRPASDNANLVQLAKRLFEREARTLEKLGKHSQIPQLLANFEEDGEFYLIQEFIPGSPLSQELPLGKQLPEARVVGILREILQILEFVHSQDVIHRDIKPGNIIRRNSDGKLVLIDFGAVKISDQIESERHTALTVGIGTKGYMPSEQSEGKPKPNSDIYALGMIGIQALTGLFPNQIREKEDLKTGEIAWKEWAKVSQPLAEILSKMVLYDYRKRYQTATQVLQDLNSLPVSTAPPPPVEDEPVMPTDRSSDLDAYVVEETRPWPQTFGSISDPLSGKNVQDSEDQGNP
ncbi:CHASE2 domain-containing protein [Leptothermofonsia sichuanensis E412]|uniref:serine/threonine-protein kinase n=1 Tax=Leptothermofonsia sichuanensis TaxID=2917832 RepID=UPI001CA6CC68|nr:serine/threonine-protein kinase [Leptothermofonsia sichuanensis]QZZ21960.1 CHASE2 domain-containing protein [Leptothermofonsia sichuanensis E412]